MRWTKHLLLWSSLATLAVLVFAAVSENLFAEWRRTQAGIADELAASGVAFSVELRQVVAPGLGRTDRCTSCHVGMAPGEGGVAGDRIRGKHASVVHDPAELGCTICHGGQGLATTAADAHGSVPHWPEPMIPARFAYAGCGSCHTHLAVPSRAALERGRDLLEQKDCLACHRVDGRGGTLRPGGAGGAEGPDLSRAGAVGFRAAWYEHHLAARDAAAREAPAASGSRASLPAAGGAALLPWRAAFGPLGPEEQGAIDEYLRSRVGAPGLVEAKALFHSLGCRGCHKVSGVGGDDGPDLTRVGQRDPGQTPFAGVIGPRTLDTWFAEHFRAPARVVAGSAMPELSLTEAQIAELTFYMLSLRRAPASEAHWPKDRVRAERFGEREFATDGATLYGTFCVACHGPAGEGMRYPGASAFPAIANPDFLAVASDELLAATVTRGRPGRRMPAWGEASGGLQPAEIAAVVRHVRALGGQIAATADPRPRRWVSARPEHGAPLYARHCAGCHGRAGEGGEGPALASQVLLLSAGDTYLVETIRRGRRGTSMQGFEQPSPVRSALAPAEVEAIVAFLRTWEERQP